MAIGERSVSRRDAAGGISRRATLRSAGAVLLEQSRIAVHGTGADVGRHRF
jgi:hypothetical protein